MPSLELGYFLVQAATGKGYAAEAARAVLRYAFETLQVGRVDLQCRADNLASQRVAERGGFIKEVAGCCTCPSAWTRTALIHPCSENRCTIFMKLLEQPTLRQLFLACSSW